MTQTLQLAKESCVKHFVFMSTVKVYGEETDSICKPEDEYGKSKLKAELELQKLEDEDFKVSIIRTPIVYGVKSLINLVNKRSMVYIGNLCHLVYEIITQGIFLASDDEPLSTSRLIELVAKIPFFESFQTIISQETLRKFRGK